jgi:hypothetical protein
VSRALLGVGLRTGSPRLTGAAVLKGAADTAVVGAQLEPQRPQAHQLAELDLVRECAAPRDKDLGVLRDLRGGATMSTSVGFKEAVICGGLP